MQVVYCRSNIQTIHCGVPQGSNLGPCKSTHANLFADDITLSCQGNSSIDIESKLNNDLINIHKWLSANKLTINVGKLNI
jgi:hypothetical protein